MSNPVGAQLYGVGGTYPLGNSGALPYSTNRAPTTTDVTGPNGPWRLGQVWVDTENGFIYQLANLTASSGQIVATWHESSTSAGALNDLAGDSGTATPSGGTINILGGTNITTTGASPTADDLTIDLDATLTGLTSVTSTTFLGSLDTNVAAAGLTVSGVTIAADGTDADISIALTPKGTGVVAVTGSLTATDSITATTSFLGPLDTNVAAAGMVISGTSLSADGTDADISISVGPKGTGVFQVNSGGISLLGGDIINAHSSAAADVTIEVTNSDNTSGASRAGFEAAVGGTSSGDPYANFLISGGQTYTMGIDNSTANDDFVLSKNAALGTSNVLSFDGTSDVATFSAGISTAGSISMTGAATQLQLEGGAATDFIGTATLVGGTIAVANTNIAAADIVLYNRSVTAGTPGTLSYVIDPGVSLTFNSSEGADTSTVTYFIVRQL